MRVLNSLTLDDFLTSALKTTYIIFLDLVLFGGSNFVQIQCRKIDGKNQTKPTELVKPEIWDGKPTHLRKQKKQKMGTKSYGHTYLL